MFRKYFIKLFAIMILVIYGGLCLTTANASYPVLKLDISNNKEAGTLESGFDAFTIADSGSKIKGITISIEPIEPDPVIPGNPATLSSRLRDIPTGIPCSLIYRDFIFARPGGIRMTLSGFLPNEPYEVTIWAFDNYSTTGDPARIADWYANGEFCLTTEFDGDTPPTDCDSHSWTGPADSDANGVIILEAYPNPGTTEQSGANNPYAFVDGLIISSVNIITTASNPEPEDLATVPSTEVQLEWEPGMTADKHDVYLGTFFNSVSDATRAAPLGVLVAQGIDPNFYDPGTLQSDTTYYWRIDEVNGTDIWKGSVWSFYIPPKTAYNPSPVDGALFADANYLDTTAILSWYEATDANSYHVYLGDVLNDVNNGTGGTDKGTVTNTNYDPGVMLQFDHTYYWRIDVFDGTTTHKGSVWSFKTSPADLGTIAMDIWDNITGGSTLNLLTDDPRYPESPSRTQKITLFDTGNDVDNDYGGRLHGWVYVPLTGDYTFWFNSAGQGELWLSTDDDPNNLMAEPIASEFVWGTYGSLAHASDPIPLIGGNRYYIMAIWKSADWDFCQVAWKGAGIRDQQIIQGCYLSPYESKQSYNPNPADSATRVVLDAILSWTPGAYAGAHDVYFGTDLITVIDANRTNDPCGVLVEQDYDANSYDPGTLDWNTTYYWRIDDVNDPNIYRGALWSFTTRDKTIIDDFESYSASGLPREAGTMRNTWIDGYYGVTFPSTLPLDSTDGKSGAWVQLASDTSDGTTNPASPALDSDASMKLYYDNDGTITWLSDIYTYDPIYSYVAPMYSEAVAAIVDAGRISTSYESRGIPNDFSGYKLLRIPYYGDTTNTVVASDKLYVTLRDADGTEVTISNPDQTIIQKPGWYLWYIKMSDFASNPNLDLTNIVRICIGIGNKSSPTSGGRGVIFLDEIKLLAEGACIPGTVLGDFDDDCTVGSADLQRMTELWLGQTPTMPNPVIQLDASALTVGNPVTSWTNTGTAGGTFADFNVANPNDSPVVEMVDGKKAVVFDGDDILRATINAPASITGNNPWTVIYTVWNFDIAFQEYVLVWTKRVGTGGTYAGVSYGFEPVYGGAVSHWFEGFDMGFDRGVPSAHTWHTIAITYQGGTNGVETVMVDGIVNATEAKTLDIWPNNPMTIGDSYDGDPDDANDPTITPYEGRFLTGAISKIQVYGVYTPPGDLALLTGTPANLKSDSIIDFKDVAILANKWLVGPILFGD